MKNFDAALHFTILYGALVAFSFFSGAFGFMQPKKKKQYLFVVFLALGIIMGFRGVHVGNDTISYIRHFSACRSYSNPVDAINSTSAEVGYVLYSWFIGQISSNARSLFIVTAMILCGSFSRFIYKHCDNPGIFCCLFVGILLFDFILSATRQSLAIAMLLFAFDAMLNKKKVRYFILTTVAVLFHNAALIFFLVYPVYWYIENQGNFKSISIAVIVMLVFVITYRYEFFLRILMWVLPKYEYYVGSETIDGEPRLSVMLKIAVYGLLFLVPKIFRRTDNLSSRMESTTGFLAVANILFLFASVRTPLLTRITASLTPFCILQFANSVQNYSRNNRKILTTLTCIAFYVYGLMLVVLKTPEWQTTYPVDLSWLI